MLNGDLTAMAFSTSDKLGCEEPLSRGFPYRSVYGMRMLSAMLAIAMALCSPTVFGVESIGAEHYVLLEIGEKVGDLDVKTVGKHVDVDWKVNDNGRGPKYKEKIDLDAAGLPVHWEIEGTAGVGAPVKETFDFTGGRAKWKSLDDSGEATSKAPLYNPNNASPWALGLLTSQVFTESAGYEEPMRYAGLVMCAVFVIGLLALPFAPETKGQPLPE